MPLLPSQRHLFDIPDDIAYFNCAYNSLRPVGLAISSRNPTLYLSLRGG